MVFEVGERVSEHARSTARLGRAGEVREVLGGQMPRYRIRWDDGHESIYTPSAGALSRLASPKRSRQSSSKRAKR
jgi:hypothetical protein